MLAYVFWHRPAEDVARDEYERRLRAFHETLDGPSACFRLARLPFEAVDGYEDWYLVDGWGALGVLNDAALAPVRRIEHDAAAHVSAHGWGAVYRLLRGVGRGRRVRVAGGGARAARRGALAARRRPRRDLGLATAAGPRPGPGVL